MDKLKKKRCPRGTRRDKKTGNCKKVKLLVNLPEKKIKTKKRKIITSLKGKMFSSKDLEEFIMKQIEKIKKQKITMTQPGSIKHLLFGSEPSEQSLSIKLGKLGEEMVKKIIIETDDVELLECGVQCIDQKTKKNKDLDLIWKNEKKKIIYYREAKGNIELDSEKLPVTIDKVKEIIETYITPSYPDYIIDIGVLNWSIYNRKKLKKGLSQIKKCEEKGIKVEHPEDLFKLLNFDWSEKNYYDFFRTVGETFRK